MNTTATFRLLLFIFPSLLVASALHSQPCNMAGVYTIGTGNAFPNLTSALSSLVTNGMGGPVILELTDTYSSSNETFPVYFGNIPCIDSSANITVRPQAGTSPISLTSASTIFLLGNSRHITIDGRPGGQGNISGLTLQSSATNGAIRFISNGSFNTIEYLTIQSSNPSSTGGAITFGASPGAITSGSRSNVIRYCTITGNSANAIYSVGSAGKNNSENTISHCEISDFTSAAIRIENYNSDWTIDNNQIFCRQPVQNATGILISDTNSSGFQILNNHIGGTDVFCGGTPMNVSRYFSGISIMAGNGENSIQGNRIANFEWSNNFAFENFAGIRILSGKVRCGTVTGNIIGSDTEIGNIRSRSTYTTSPDVSGIVVGEWTLPTTLDSVWISNNIIGGFLCETDSQNYLETTLRGIYVWDQYTGAVTINTNRIGSETELQSMQTTIGDVHGISVENNTLATKNYITDNLIRGLTGSAYGIYIMNGINYIADNIISDCLNDRPDTTGFAPGFNGIFLIGCRQGTEVTKNTIRNFNVHAQYSGACTGIEAMMVSGTEISKNFIHDFYSTVFYSLKQGIFLRDEPLFTGNRIINNMIRFGNDSSGIGSNLDEEMIAITTYLASTTVSHNTIYFDGHGDGKSIAVNILGVYGTDNRITNNIFSNKRYSNGGIWNNNYGLYSPNGLFPLSGLTLDYNIYQQGGLRNYVAGELYLVNRNWETLSDWTTFSSYDAHSQNGDPNFINANGDINTVDLHLKQPSIADATGILEPSILYDFDSELRSLYTPVDIGADAINLTTGTSFTSTNNIFNIYPNPAQDIIRFQIIPNVTEGVCIKSIDGRILLNETRPVKDWFKVSHLPNGIYFCELTISNGQKKVSRFVIQR